MTLIGLIGKAAHLAKDIPTDATVPTNKATFDALNPRFSYDIYKDWVNESYRELLQILPVDQIRIVRLDNQTCNVNGYLEMPDDMLFPIRVAVTIAGITVGARYISMNDLLAAEQNTWKGGTSRQPLYTYQNTADTKKKIRFSPIGEWSCSVQYIKDQVLSIDSHEPDIEERHHHLIAEMTALKKMVVDNDAAGPGLNKKIRERIETLTKNADKGTGVR